MYLESGLFETQTKKKKKRREKKAYESTLDKHFSVGGGT